MQRAKQLSKHYCTLLMGVRGGWRMLWCNMMLWLTEKRLQAASTRFAMQTSCNPSRPKCTSRTSASLGLKQPLIKAECSQPHNFIVLKFRSDKQQCGSPTCTIYQIFGICRHVQGTCEHLQDRFANLCIGQWTVMQAHQQLCNKAPPARHRGKDAKPLHFSYCELKHPI